jgi:hypothetical protein
MADSCPVCSAVAPPGRASAVSAGRDRLDLGPAVFCSRGLAPCFCVATRISSCRPCAPALRGQRGATPSAPGRIGEVRRACGDNEGACVRGHQTSRGIKAGPRIGPAPTGREYPRARKSRAVRSISDGMQRPTTRRASQLAMRRDHAVDGVAPCFCLAAGIRGVDLSGFWIRRRAAVAARVPPRRQSRSRAGLSDRRTGSRLGSEARRPADWTTRLHGVRASRWRS